MKQEKNFWKIIIYSQLSSLDMKFRKSFITIFTEIGKRFFMSFNDFGKCFSTMLFYCAPCPFIPLSSFIAFSLKPLYRRELRVILRNSPRRA